MGLFKDILSADQTLFKNEEALEFEFIPKNLPYRENEHHYIADSIKPLLAGRNGRNLFIHGAPGIGKTAAVKYVFRELEFETEDVIPIYVNCWKQNTSFKILSYICEELDYHLTHNKKTEELLRVIKKLLNKKAAVFAFDEVDKLEDQDFLYLILEEIYRKSVFLITNYKDWVVQLDDRVRSRMLSEMLYFRPYNKEEMLGILKQRAELAFYPYVWEDGALKMIAEEAAPSSDVRKGLYLMKYAGQIAESESSKKITKEHVTKALAKTSEFSIKAKEELDDESRFVLDIIKSNSGKKIGELFKLYQEAGGKGQYKTFQRKIKNLAMNKFVSVRKIIGGPQGSTTIIKYGPPEKKLTEFEQGQ
ncbi:AAA family ATPase [Candidatus Woesearchaeota archaeon]|nr:MAG: AAA family ATPase [Candidatus Woesearchaeota archaeon]